MSVYMSISDMMDGFHEGIFCKLKRSLYGYKKQPGYDTSCCLKASQS